MTDRYNRQIRFFGAEGQRRLREASIVLLGTGGNGMHIVQQLSYAGIDHWSFVEFDIVDDTNLNRLVGAVPDDIGTLKADVAIRMVKSLHPDSEPGKIVGHVEDPEFSDQVEAAIANATLAIGCFDKELPRLTAVKLCSGAGVPYMDLATDIMPATDASADDPTDAVYGGRVVFSYDGTGCVVCLDALDMNEVTVEQMPAEQRAIRDKIYGLDAADLDGTGPSVVMLNGVVASLACMEAMAFITGLRPPYRQLTYYGNLGVVRVNNSTGPPDCLYCHAWRSASGDPDAA